MQFKVLSLKSEVLKSFVGERLLLLPQFWNFLLVFAPLVFNYYQVFTLFKTFKSGKREKKKKGRERIFLIRYSCLNVHSMALS